MAIISLDYNELISHINQDNSQKRFNAKVILVNNLAVYFKLINELDTMADISIELSDEKFCVGNDTMPDLKMIVPILDSNNDKNVLIKSIGEYLRFGLSVEENRRCLFSILSRQAHAKKRVWIPIYAAKDEYLSVVGDLDDEHYPEVAYEIECTSSGFEMTVFSNSFSQAKSISNVIGMRQWIQLWDNQKVKPGMALITRHAKQIRESDGLYSVRVIKELKKYFETMIESDCLIDYSVGTDEKWLALVEYANKPSTPIREVIKRALNIVNFDANQVLNGWNSLDDTSRWYFWLWYYLGLNGKSDYISFAVKSAVDYDDIPRSLEMSILNVLDNPNFEKWIIQRKSVMEGLRIIKYSDAFWTRFDSIGDYRKQLKILTGHTHDEKTKIIQIVSNALNMGLSISDFKSVLAEKYPDFLFYMQETQYGYDDLKNYMKRYKFAKVKDEFSLDMSDLAGTINSYDYDSRSMLLNSLKVNSDSYYLWIDGMGVEWIDLLIKKISDADADFRNPIVSVGTAVLPTVTTVNMACADPDTVSRKLNDLDSLGHIKDKSDCNYFSVIAKQLEFISQIAQDVIRIASEIPEKDIVITADHGMSRMVAKGFHILQGVSPHKSAEVCSLGRYCKFPDGIALPDVSNTIKGDGVIAFKTYGHFKASGYAPGENHGGATPEELLVPVIYYKRKKPLLSNKKQDCSYRIDSTITLLATGMCELPIKVTGVVDKVTIEVKSIRIAANKKSDQEWVALIPGLSVNHDYQVSIYLNNLYTEKKETVYVKAAGLDFDDDF